MSDFSYVLLYVEKPAASVAFYTDLLGRPPVESSPAFALFVLPSGMKFGLWARDTVEPKAVAASGGGEVCVSVADSEAVDRTHAEWKARGLKIAQPPTAMDFGRTFVALDPDGHRLRVFAPAAS
jgi:catechol 2,3-dioxygenase-like lactoylglutathione lyase family enzyme